MGYLLLDLAAQNKTLAADLVFPVPAGHALADAGEKGCGSLTKLPGLKPLIAALLLVFPALSHGATLEYKLYLDSDNNTATGCAVAVAEAGYSGSLSGIDQVITLSAQNTTAPASVTGIVRAACSGGAFGAPVAVSPGGWPVAAGAGYNGADAIEGFVPLAGLGATGTVRLYAGANPAGQGVADVILSQSGSIGGSAILAALAGGSPASIPALHPGALALLALAIAAMTHRRLRRKLPPLAAVTLAVTLGLAGGKGAEAVLVTITPDGNIADWSGIAPAAQDALGDTANGNPANDFAALYLAADGANLYYRVDVAGLAPVDHAPVVNAPTGTATDTTVTETNQISDADGLRNVTYYLYQNDGATLVSSNATGAFTGLTASTPYKMKTTAETYNPATGAWTLQTSPLGSITTAATPDTTPPVAIGETVTTAYDTALNGITVLANDSDNSGTVLLGNITNPVGGTFTKNGNTIDFVPTTGFVGNATCTYQVKDPTGNISTAVLTVTVSPQTAPSSAPGSFTLTNDSGVSSTDGITMNQPAASWMTVAGASSYEVSPNGTTWTDVGNVTGYAFGGLADGGYTLQVRAKNGAGTGPAATKGVTLDTTPPTAPAGNETMTPGETRNISVTFNEAIQSTAAITVNSGTLNSYAVAGNVLTLNYTASATGGTYNNALSVVATNLAGDPSAAVGVRVVVNSAPTAGDVTVNGGTAPTATYDLAANIGDAQDPTASLTVIVVTGPVHGSLVWNTNSSFTYTVTEIGYIGNDSFTYKVRDTGGLESTVQTVSLTNFAF